MLFNGCVRALSSSALRSCPITLSTQQALIRVSLPCRTRTVQARVASRSRSPASARLFSTSLTTSKDDESFAISLLSSLMHKRGLLLNKSNAHANVELAKELGELDILHRHWQDWQEVEKHAATVLRMTDPDVESDADMRMLAEEEARDVLEQMEELRLRINAALLPQDPTDAQSAIVEIRPGVGGDEAAVFTAQVARMYTRFCEALPGFSVEQLSVMPVDVSTHNTAKVESYKEVILSIQGPQAYGLLRYEAGVHRVQRIPVTVNVPKLQTSAIAVIVLPGEGPSSAKKGKSDFFVDPKEVKEEVMRSRGAGGQHVNKTESAVRLTHEPTGISVSMQDSRSQHQNRTAAWRVLTARLLDRKMRQDQAEERSVRKSQVVTMDRGDRIRTYNFPQDRVTDHRISLSTNNIDQIMEGDASEDGGLFRLMNALREHFDGLTLMTLKQQVDQDIVQLTQDKQHEK